MDVHRVSSHTVLPAGWSLCHLSLFLPQTSYYTRWICCYMRIDPGRSHVQWMMPHTRTVDEPQNKQLPALLFYCCCCCCVSKDAAMLSAMSQLQGLVDALPELPDEVQGALAVKVPGLLETPAAEVGGWGAVCVRCAAVILSLHAAGTSSNAGTLDNNHQS